ncbi:hypothetical protein ABH920_003494 [Catenulispora sp. EB89]|uniref:DUF4132 domain-containing protein n=1 Tax=Catenulispora sp. EB89 TaxID=3156257 RepID=UPI003514F6B2
METGLDVLTEIGGDTALIHLHLPSRKIRNPGLRALAEQRVQTIADDLQLTTDQLGDRLVPDSGLDDQGSMTLDYGPRRFVVGFDEQLAPYMRDETGKQLRTLPKPGPKDDPELAEAAYRRFTGMRKDLRTLAADQIRRFEQLARQTHAFTPAECDERVATRFATAAIPPYRALSLEHHGWHRAPAGFGGLIHHLLRELPDGHTVVADLAPELVISDIGESGDQRIVRVRLCESAYGYEDPDEALSFGPLDAVTASEALRDLIGITSD